jgi:ankyrin repeat protein
MPHSAAMLIKAGLDINEKENNGYTPLMLAAMRGDDAVVKCLLQLGANPAAVNADGKSATQLADEKGAKRMLARLLSPALGRMSRRAAKEHEALRDSVLAHLRALWEFEKEPTPSLDRPAALFGEVLGEVCAFGLDGERERIARAVGRAVGKWVYLIDALDDFEKDRRHGRYNPIASVYGDVGEGREAIELALGAALAEADAALDLLEFPDGDMQALTENILRYGMPSVYEKLTKKEKACDE